MKQRSNQETELAWIDAWNDLYELARDRRDVICLSPDWLPMTVEECKGWLQDSAYLGYSLQVSKAWYEGRKAIKVDRTEWKPVETHMESDIEESVADKIRWASDDGCPVAARTDFHAAEMASIARRRWKSYARRNKKTPDTVENRIDDLARGLAEKFTEGGWPMVGPLISDYKWLSEQIAPILAERSE